MINPATRILVVGLVLGIAACLLAQTPASAAAPVFTLWTDGTNGWSSTNTSFTNPGPPLAGDRGDNVTLALNGRDGADHVWFIDYNNDTRPTGGGATATPPPRP